MEEQFTCIGIGEQLELSQAVSLVAEQCIFEGKDSKITIDHSKDICMVCETHVHSRFSWTCRRGKEKGLKRSLCLDCIFEMTDSLKVDQLARESTAGK